MIKNKKILITSALPYVNNVPHLGNIVGCVLSADVFARFNRSIGNETLFVCGTDEHGTTTEAKAAEEGLTPREVCDKYYAIHKSVYEWFNISFDIFGRTSDKIHAKITQDIFLKLKENGFIHPKEVEQLYCDKCEKFLADRFVEGECPYCKFNDARGDQCDACGKLLTPTELKNPRCKIHNSPPVIKSTKHLFLDLKKLQAPLERWVEIQSKEGKWSQNAITTTNSWFKEGLLPRAITRDLKWGIPVPLEEFKDKVFYVWFDAPIGYISITAKLTDSWQDWWKKPDETLLYQFMAKDNIPFHTIIFPASLMGTTEKYTLLHHISSTEYLQYEGGKFSKSRNIGVFGDDAKNSGIPSDAYRYYLLINRPETADSVFSWDEFGARINNELVANIGNFVNRTLTFIDKYLGKKVTECELSDKDVEFLEKIKELEGTVTENLQNVEIKSALKNIMAISHLSNQYFQECAPWKSRTENEERCRISLYILVNVVKDLAILIKPYLPDTSKNIFLQLDIPKKDWHDLGRLSIKDHTIGEPKILFEKIDNKQIAKLKERFSGEKKDILIKEEERSKENLFSMLNLKVGKIIDVKKHANADKLFIEEVDLGTEKRQIISGLAGHYTTDELLGKKVIIVTNLKTAKIRGVESHGMLLAAENKDGEVGVLYVKDAKEGESVAFDKTLPIEKEISFNDFLKVKMEVKEGIAYFEGNALLANNKRVKAEKVINGIIR